MAHEDTEFLSNLSVEQLQNLSKEANTLIEQKRQGASKEAFQKFEEIASSIGMTVEQIINENTNANINIQKKTDPKYISPNGETWAGRGLEPIWLRTALDNGAKREDFLNKDYVPKQNRVKRQKKSNVDSQKMHLSS